MKVSHEGAKARRVEWWKEKLPGEQLHILQHSLGLDQYGRGNSYRKHFVTGPESKDFEHCQALVALGLMEDHGCRGKLTGGMHLFTVTPNGVDAVALQSPRPPKVSRSKQRYLDYLDISDCFENFHHYLIWLGLKKKGLVE